MNYTNLKRGARMTTATFKEDSIEAALWEMRDNLAEISTTLKQIARLLRK